MTRKAKHLYDTKYMSNPFSEALKQVEAELAEADALAVEVERKRAALRQEAAVLRARLGVVQPEDQSLTDAVLMVVKGWPGYATAGEVMERLFMMGFHVQTASVATILCRLAKNGQIESLVGPNRTAGYGWKTEVNNRDMQAARRAATVIGKKRKETLESKTR